MGCIAQSNPILINTKIVNNNDYQTSGIHIYNGSEDEGPILINCTICDNSNCSKGTIRQLWDTNVTLINCILRNNAQYEIWFDYQGNPNTVTISYTNIEDSINAINTNNNGTIHWLEGNIDSIPQFVGGDPFRYELTEGSPCIDAGTPDTTGLNLPELDLAGNPRIYNGIIDMGAYEWQGQGIDEPDTSFIHKLYLFQNKPNPFSSSTKITFISADYERIKDYKLSIYNARGQLIRTYNGKRDNFWVKTDIVWDGTDEDGNKVPNGVYFYKLSYGENSVTKKMILVR
ncbi:MAG: T9SS type A sorting domain-containing protein [Candidatus Cloacimonetes bacterium]|nr:T9SS type A sorting domain-containing protein [Candidatus Cloacimonadota bacterium]